MNNYFNVINTSKTIKQMVFNKFHILYNTQRCVIILNPGNTVYRIPKYH